MIIMGDNDLAADQKNIIARTRECGAGLTSLRDDHLSILSNIRNEEENKRNTGDGEDKGLEERINAVTESLQLLDVGVAESGVMLSLASHFDTLEADRSMARLEMRRVKDENDWLREELEDTEKRLEDALARLAGLEEEKKHWLFMEEVRKNEKEADLRPVTPSKIPVGAFRVEEEKAINRALNGGPANGSMDSNRQSSERAVSPAPPSRIPKFSSKLGANYKRVQVRDPKLEPTGVGWKDKEKMEKAANERQEKGQKLRGKRHKLSLTPATSHSVIPSR
eukprot:GFUD01015374.1.p1 GENE.GFUD01015374.1~~GFUD01015374.1.p1  ORF type:complete len:280 (+),score=89.55 GFUD01015374.1:597-1436(+)